MNGIISKLERVAPNQEQVARQQDIPYKVNIDVNFGKCCDWINWLYLSRFWSFFCFFSLKALPKRKFKTLDNIKSYKPTKKPPAQQCFQVCVQKVKYDVKFMKKRSLAYAGYISDLFTPFPPIQLKPNTTKTPNKLQHLSLHSKFKPTGLSGIRKSHRNLLAQNILFRKVTNGLTANIYPTREPPPCPSPPQDVESNAHVAWWFLFLSRPGIHFEECERVTPNQEQVACQQDIPYKVEISMHFVKCCCQMNWLYFLRFQQFFAFLALKHFQKGSLKLQTILIVTNQ